MPHTDELKEVKTIIAIKDSLFTLVKWMDDTLETLQPTHTYCNHTVHEDHNMYAMILVLRRKPKKITKRWPNN